jgi:hypothetical protein
VQVKFIKLQIHLLFARLRPNTVTNVYLKPGSLLRKIGFTPRRVYVGFAQAQASIREGFCRSTTALPCF